MRGFGRCVFSLSFSTSLTTTRCTENTFRRYVLTTITTQPRPFHPLTYFYEGLDIVPLHPDLHRVGSTDLAARVQWVQANLYVAFHPPQPPEMVPRNISWIFTDTFLSLFPFLAIPARSLDRLPFPDNEFDFV